MLVTVRSLLAKGTVPLSTMNKSVNKGLDNLLVKGRHFLTLSRAWVRASLAALLNLGRFSAPSRYRPSITVFNTLEVR